MEWLWISALVIISLFVLLLCWLFFKDYSCFPCEKKRWPGFPASFIATSETFFDSGQIISQSRPPFADQYDLTSDDTQILNLRYGSFHVSDIITEHNGVPQLDLHRMTVIEAKEITSEFLIQSRGKHDSVYIVTGRGLHSENKTPILKPIIGDLLTSSGYRFDECYKGGCYEVHLHQMYS
ncbi:hypothetical protein Pcinc_008248 [Petrolisthes cinctipes]|uniref:Smr domain-containing protein n=1 Tax=Petrolisthes cinctipes TaxID=88211 RepID=A0AAE1KWN3_PETCI|nr:hypothetical protein Pcinc_008248 [Petrolisthes cinctipes]